MLPKKARILLACVEQAYRRLLPVLPGHELTFVKTFTDAQAALRANRFNLIMIGTHFDESRVFDLLRCMKADPNYTEVPVMCFRGIKFGGVRTNHS